MQKIINKIGIIIISSTTSLELAGNLQDWSLQVILIGTEKCTLLPILAFLSTDTIMSYDSVIKRTSNRLSNNK